MRSQSHGERKVFAERVPRWNPREREDGWHHHYDALAPGHRFVREADALLAYDGTFATEYLVERLTGVGIVRAA